MAFFKALFKQNARLVLASGLLGLVSGAINAQLIALVNLHLDRSASQSWLHSSWFFASLVAAALITGILTQVAITYLTEKLSFALREQLCRKVADMQLPQLETIGGQRLTASLAQDIPAVTTALMGIPVLIINSAILVGCLVYLGFLSLPTMFYLLGFILFAVLTYQLPEKFALGHLERNREQWNHLYTAFDALIEGAKELKLNHKRQMTFFANHISNNLKALRQSALGFQLIYAAINHWSKLLYFVFIGGLLFFLAGQQGLDTKTLAAFVIIVLYLIAPVDSVIDIIPKFRTATIAYRNMARLDIAFGTHRNAEAHGDPDLVQPNPFDDCKGHQGIHLEKIRYTFFRDADSKPFTLGPLDLTIQPGEILFLVGGNGSGKTTLAKLLTGLYAPQAGRIYLHGTGVTGENRAAYRQHFSAVFSDFFLFENLDGLVGDNLDRNARFYLEKLHLTHKVDIREGKLSTTKLSSGQRKRLALLTAYLEDRPIYLFDEWAADQDPEFKKVFYEDLLPELKAKGKTLIVISHDDRFFHLADRVLKLREGDIEAIETIADKTASLLS